MDIQFRDMELFELKKLIFKLSIDLDECREGIQRIQSLPESGSVSTSDHQEEMKAVQHALDKHRTQLGTHEKKLQDGERHMHRLHEEVTAHKNQPKPEVREGLPSDVQVAMETRFTRI